MAFIIAVFNALTSINFVYNKTGPILSLGLLLPVQYYQQLWQHLSVFLQRYSIIFPWRDKCACQQNQEELLVYQQGQHQNSTTVIADNNV
jgi:hypothetical protein